MKRGRKEQGGSERPLDTVRAKPRLADLLIASASVFTLFGVLQFSTPDICCGDFDGYYHIRWSRMLWEALKSGRLPQFRALPLTMLSPGQYSDQHFLFHLLLIPFTWTASLRDGAKWAAVTFGSIAVICCFWLLWRYCGRHALIWLIALLGSSSLFLERMSMTRAQSVSLVFIVAGMAVLFERKYRWLVLIGFLYVWTYNLFVVLACMVVIWAAVEWWNQRRLDLAPIGWTALGFFAGFSVNPYFPRNANLFWEHLTSKVVNQPGGGAEWYSLPGWLLLLSSFAAFAAMVFGYIGFGSLLRSGDRSKLRKPLFLLIFASLLLVATVRSKRFTEYWPPIAILFAAFTLDELLDTRSELQLSRRTKTATASVAVMLLACLVYQLHLAELEMQSPIGPQQYHDGSEWLRAHVPPGDIVFNVAWDDFPKLFYYDPSRAYVSGLDPMYLSDAHPELGRLYDQIAAGHADDPGNTISKAFGARYIFVGKPVPNPFYAHALFSGQFDKLYEDSQCVILGVKESNER